MCNLETEGTKYGCGHYVTTRQVCKLDCNNQFCTHSRRHPQYCPNCRCERYLGPDAKETVTRTTPDYCVSCDYWFKSRLTSAGRAR